MTQKFILVRKDGTGKYCALYNAETGERMYSGPELGSLHILDKLNVLLSEVTEKCLGIYAAKMLETGHLPDTLEKLDEEWLHVAGSHLDVGY